MRIVAGTAKGVRLAPVPAGVRPLSDRAREGLFSSLGTAAVEGAAVLDLFAGTGAAGIEALSRGAARASFVDASRVAVSVIRRNLALTRLGDRAQVHRADVLRYLTREAEIVTPYDLVLCDPPYGLGSQLDDILQALAGGWLRGEAWTVAVTRGRKSSTPVIPLHWAIARRLRYGDSLVVLFRPRRSA
jgi:16S rRNA (guanine966-N2)-methyltransferase